MQPWKRFEYRVTEFLRKHGWDAKRVPLSGAAPALKGDVRASKGDCVLLIDAKYTSSKDWIRIQVDDIKKNIRNSNKKEIPIIAFSFRHHRRLYAIFQRPYADQFTKFRKLTVRSKRSVLFKKEDMPKDECLIVTLGNDEEYAVAGMDSLLKILPVAQCEGEASP